MSIRSWQANPSAHIELDGRVWPVVTQDDLIKAVVDGAVLLDRAGGCLQVVLQRQPTPLPNEMVTVAAIVVWQDRTNAKAQPEDRGLDVEQGSDLALTSNGVSPEAQALVAQAQMDAEFKAAADAAEAAHAAGEPGPDPEPVDEAAVPEALRG